MAVFHVELSLSELKCLFGQQTVRMLLLLLLPLLPLARRGTKGAHYVVFPGLTESCSLKCDLFIFTQSFQVFGTSWAFMSGDQKEPDHRIILHGVSSEIFQTELDGSRCCRYFEVFVVVIDALDDVDES